MTLARTPTRNELASSYVYQLEEHGCLHLNNVVSFITRNKRKCSIDSLKILRKGHKSVCRNIVETKVSKKIITSILMINTFQYSTICHTFYNTILTHWQQYHILISLPEKTSTSCFNMLVTIDPSFHTRNGATNWRTKIRPKNNRKIKLQV